MWGWVGGAGGPSKSGHGDLCLKSNNDFGGKVEVCASGPVIKVSQVEALLSLPVGNRQTGIVLHISRGGCKEWDIHKDALIINIQEVFFLYIYICQCSVERSSFGYQTNGARRESTVEEQKRGQRLGLVYIYFKVL